eukprot:924912-Prymnesium_polylepis.1
MTPRTVRESTCARSAVHSLSAAYGTGSLESPRFRTRSHRLCQSLLKRACRMVRAGAAARQSRQVRERRRREDGVRSSRVCGSGLSRVSGTCS